VVSNYFFGDNAPTQDNSLANTWTPSDQEPVNNSDGGVIDTIASIGAAPFQVAGGLAQGIANFVVGGAVSAVGAELATGAGVVNPLTTSNIARMGLQAKRFFLPFMFDEEDQQNLNANNEQWNRGADEWVKQYNMFSEGIAEHPLFKSETVDNTLGEGYKGAHNVHALMGAMTTWTADQGKAAGNKVMEWAASNPEKAQELAKQGITPEDYINEATAIETAINSIPLVLPYFGKDAYMAAREKMKSLKKANETGDVPNTMSGKYNRPENPNNGVMRNFPIEPTGKYIKPDLPFEQIKPDSMGLDSSRPGPMPSTDAPTTFLNKSGEVEQILGRNGFIRTFQKTHKGVDAATAEKAWNEYANEVTLQAYPDAYMAFEMKASGFNALKTTRTADGPMVEGVRDANQPNLTGEQIYLNHVFDAKNSSDPYAFKRTLTLEGTEYNLKDYVTYTPSEFFDTINNGVKADVLEQGTVRGPSVPFGSAGPEAPRGSRWRPNVTGPTLREMKLQDIYKAYINEKSREYGLEPIEDFNASVSRAFDIREMEFENLKLAQEQLAWKERYFENELEPLVEKIKTNLERGPNLEGTTPTSPRGYQKSKEGPDYTSEQVDAYFRSNAKQDIVEAHMEDIISKATTPITAKEIPWRGRRSQAGIARPDVFAEGIEKMAEPVVDLVKDAVDVKRSVEALTGAAPTGAVSGKRAKKTRKSKQSSTGMLFPDTERPIFNIKANDKFLGKRGSVLDSTFAEIIGATNAQEWMRKAQDKSPTLRRVLDSFDRPFEGMGRAVVNPYTETYKLRVAAFDQSIKTAFKSLNPSQWGSFGGLSKLQNAELNKVFRGITPLEKASPVIRKAYTDIRKVLDDHYSMMVKAGVPGLSDRIGYINNYLHRAYDMEGKFHLEDSWMKLMDKHKIDKTLGKEIFDNLTTHNRLYRVSPKDIDTFLNDNPLAHRKTAIDYERTLKMIPDRELAPFLNDNVYQTLTKYSEEWSHRLTFAERYGANMEKIRADLGKISEELEAVGEHLPKYAAQKIYGIVQALDNNYKQINSRTGKNIQKGILSAVNLALLPTVTLSSMAELIMPLGMTSAKDFVRSIPDTVSIAARKVARRVVKDVPKSLKEQLFDDTGAAFEGSNHIALSQIGQGLQTKVDHAFFTAVGLRHFTMFSKLSAVNSFISHAETLMKATKSEQTMKDWLKKGGFNAAKAKKLTEFLDYYQLDLGKGKDWFAKGMPKEHEFYAQIVRGALRFADDAVLTPNPATVPLWHSNPHFALVKHLKTFTSLMFTRVMRRAARNFMRNDMHYNLLYGPKALATATGMVATGVLINQIMDQMNYGDKPTPFEKTPGKEILRGFERVGFPGPLSYIYDSIYTSKLGLAGVVPGPAISLAIEGSIDVGKWLRQGDSKSLSKFIAKKASVLGKISGSRDWLQDNIQEGLDTIKPPASGKDWAF